MSYANSLKVLLCTCILILITNSFIFSQSYRGSFRTSERVIELEEQAENRFVYLFDEFQKAVLYVQNEAKELRINYRLLRDEFLVLDENGTWKALSRELRFDSLVVDDKMTFVYHPQHGYFEKLSLRGRSIFYIKYQTTYSMQEIRQGAYGDAPSSAAVESVSILAGQNHVMSGSGELLLVENVSGNPVRVNLHRFPTLVFLQNGAFLSLNTRRDLTRNFPNYDSDIRRFLRQERIAFDQRDDLRKLAAFIEGLKDY